MILSRASTRRNPSRDRSREGAGERGAALLLSLLVLLVLVVIMSQLNIATQTDERVGRNTLTLDTMELAIESALLEVSETLIMDAEAGGSGEGDETGGAGGAGAAGGGAPDVFGGGAGGPGGDEEQAVDSRQDDWAKPIRTEINGIRLRILVQDEDSKLNVLTMLSEDPDEAEKAFERVVRVLDWCRHGTEADIEGGDARAMAQAIREHLTDRTNSFLPRPELVTDNDEQRDIGLPLSMREFVVLEGFEEDHFRDYAEEDGTIVHSITSFLTVWTAVQTRDQLEQSESDEPGGAPAGGGQGGTVTQNPDGTVTATGGSGGGGDGGPGGISTSLGATDESTSASTGGGGGGGGGGGTEGMGVSVNINTAPVAVLRSLMDDREVTARLWEAVLEYRNEEDEEALGEDEEPPLDEFGEEIIVPKIFEDLSILDSEFDDYQNLEPIVKAELDNLLTTQSNVFSIIVTAQKPTGVGAGMDFAASQEELEEQERSGQSLTRTVRCVVWRRQGGDSWELVPLERWEVLDYMPYEVEDFPDEDDRPSRR